MVSWPFRIGSVNSGFYLRWTPTSVNASGDPAKQVDTIKLGSLKKTVRFELLCHLELMNVRRRSDWSMLLKLGIERTEANMESQGSFSDDGIFAEFKRHIEDSGGSEPSCAEDAFISKLVPKVHRMARAALTNEVRRLFDSNDITNTVLRSLVQQVRNGRLRVETEGQFMSLLGTMTKRAVIEKHRYLNALLRRSDHTLSLDQANLENEDIALFDLSPAEDGLRDDELLPVDELILAESMRETDKLCRIVRDECGLQPDEWLLFKFRILDEKSWETIAHDLRLHGNDGRPSENRARMKFNRMVAELRTRLTKYEAWLKDKPQ